jgi:hypothetical protein
MNEEKIFTQQTETELNKANNLPPIFPIEEKKEEMKKTEVIKQEYVLPPKSKNNNLLIYIVLFIVLFGLTLFLGWKYVVGEKVMSSFFPTPTPTVVIQGPVSPTVAADPTANWKTYKNDIYGFEFNYPGNWTFFDTNKPRQYSLYSPEYVLESTASATIKNGGSFSILVDYNNANNQSKTLDEWARNINAADSQKITFSGREAIRSSLLNAISNYAVSVSFIDQSNGENNKGIIILQMTSNQSDSEKYNKIFDQILSTFRFVEKSTSVTIVPTATESAATESSTTTIK